MKVKRLPIIFMFLFTFALIPVIKVNAASNNILIEKAYTEPGVVEPGQQFKLNFTLKNPGTKELEKILLKLVSIEGKNTLTGFSPMGGTNDIYLSSIAKGKTSDISTTLLADTQLKAGAYNIVINITGKEKNGSNFEDNKIIGIVVTNKANPVITALDIQDEKTPSKKKLSLDFVNSGKGTLSNVMVTVNTDDKQQSKYYGTVEPTDENNYEQVIEVTKDIKGKITINYEDELNRAGSITKDFDIKGPDNTEKVTASSDKEKKGFMSSVGKFFKRLFGLGE